MRTSFNEIMGRSNASDLAKITQHIDFPSIVLFGDSVTNQNGAFNDDTGLYWEADGYFFWTQYLSKGHFKVLRQAGIGGNTTTQMLARLASDVLAYPSDYVLVEGGVNDVDDVITAETTIANLTNIYNRIKANHSKLIIVTVTPSDTFTTDTEMLKVTTINNFIKNYALANKDVILCDFWGAVVDTDGRNWQASLTADGTHPNEAGAKRMGTRLYNALQSVLSMSDEHLLSNTYTDAFSLLGNSGLLIGDTGGKATGWTMTGTGAVWSKNFYSGDTESYNEQVITVADSAIDCSLYKDLTTGIPGGGTKLQGLVRVKLSAITALTNVKMMIQYDNGTGLTGLTYSNVTNFASAANLLPAEAIYTTPIAVLPAGVTKIRTYINITGLIGVAKISNPTLRIMP